MKNVTLIHLAILLLCVVPCRAKDASPIPDQKTSAHAKAEPAPLTRFDLDFPGGTPAELVDAIQQALKRPLNVVIPTQSTKVRIPPLRMRNVTVVDLFKSLEQASPTSQISVFNGSLQQRDMMYYFRTDGTPNDDSVWYFIVQGGIPEGKAARFFLLAPFLEKGLTVEDITTAVQTGWRLLGRPNSPELHFHRETNLLIAVGEWSDLQMIDQVLQALTPTPARKPGAAAAEKKT